ncbi:hypothetical protein [Anoxybacteroides tepidamans]|uniref:hypothetical protein n=1 Tax=Anoxybacteroides tepidamans TaxID=265948 RepID=UPI0004809467|nr:hypothetical protein [Anoxybacillus tepidamans]
MNFLRLLNLGRNQKMWGQLLRLTGRRRNNGGMIWAIVSFGLGAAVTALLNMRRQRASRYALNRPFRRAMSTINSFMGRRMRRPSLAAVEISQEIATKPENVQQAENTQNITNENRPS